MIYSPLSATEYIKEGRLSDALQAMVSEVHGNENDAAPRLSLIQLFCVMGQWDGAEAQLEALEAFDKTHRAWRQKIAQALQGEKLRRETFEGTASPVILGRPSAWIEPLVEALKPASARSQAALRRRAYEAAPEVSARIGGEDLPRLADSDCRLGPVLEGIMDGKYCWIPLERIRSLEIEAPCELQHLVWAEARATWWSGGESSFSIPTRYPGSELEPDDRVRLGRLTRWEELGEGQFRGVGQRHFTADGLYLPLLDLREIEFHLN